MTNKKRSNQKCLLSLFIIFIIVLLLPISITEASSMKLNKKTVTLSIGEKTTLKVIGTKEKITWSSNKKSIATVTSKGVVTAKKEGTANISAKVGGKTYSCKLTVLPVSLYINGNKTKSAPFEQGGVVYVPLKEVVTGMGDTYKWNSDKKTATVQVAGMKYTFRANSSMMTIDGEVMPMETKEINDTVVPVDVKAILKSEVLYIPLSVVETYFEYPVNTETVGKIYIGKVTIKEEGKDKTPTPTNTPTPTPTEKPKTTPTPKPTDKATSSDEYREDVIDKIAILLEGDFNTMGGEGANGLFYNKDWPEIRKGADITMTIDKHNDISIILSNWKDKVPTLTKELLTTLLPNDGEMIYNKTDYFFNSTAMLEYYEADGHKVRLMWSDEALKLYILIYE